MNVTKEMVDSFFDNHEACWKRRRAFWALVRKHGNSMRRAYDVMLAEAAKVDGSLQRDKMREDLCFVFHIFEPNHTQTGCPTTASLTGAKFKKRFSWSRVVLSLLARERDMRDMHWNGVRRHL